MEPIFWKKLPCLKEQKWDKWLERLVQAVEAQTPTPALLTRLILCKEDRHPPHLASWKPGSLPSPPHLTADLRPLAFTPPTSLTSPGFSPSPSPLPLSKLPSSLPCTTAIASNQSQPFLTPCPPLSKGFQNDLCKRQIWLCCLHSDPHLHSKCS